MWDEGKIRKWVLGSCRGEANAQQALYAAAYPYGLTVALYYGDNRQTAEEVLQDSFLKLFQTLAKNEAPPEQFRPWFRRIVINTAIDAYRRRQRELRVIPLPAREVALNGAIDRLNTQDLYRLLHCLPPTYRIVFNLHVLEELSHPEIAALLDISVGTSKSNLHKARRYLQRLAPPFFNLDSKLSNV